MNKEEFLKIQTCVLKVNIHCDGCKQKVKKILQKIDGVYTIKIDSEQGKVTVSGNIDAATLVKKLTKNGKHAEIWGASKANNSHQNQLSNQLKTLHMDNGKGGNNKGQGQKNGGNNPPKGGPQGQNPQIQQQLQQLQQLKGYQDLKIPPQLMKDMRMPIINKDQNQKSVKFSVPEEDMTDEDDYDDDDDDDDYEDDDYDDDEMDDMPMHNKKPVMGNGHGGAQMPNITMNNIMKGVGNAGNNGGNGAGNLNKGGSGGGNIPVQMNLGGANGGKKGGDGNNNGGNQNQGGGKGGKNVVQPQDGKNGGHNKNGNGGGGGAGNGTSFNANGGKNGGGMKDMHHGMMPNMMNMGQMGMNMPMPMGHQMGNLPMGQMGHLSAVQGLPASAANGGGGGGGAGYFPGGANPEQMAGNPYYQQHLATMMMNQQRANGNERFHPMMYARPPPAVNYMPPYPPYPYPPPPGDRLDHYSMFSDENTSSCTVM